MLGNGPYLLGDVPHVLGNGPQMLGKSTFGLVSHSGLRYCTVCGIRNFFAFRILSHWVLCRIRGYVVRYYVVRHYVSFGVMSFGIMSNSALCRIWSYVVRDCVVRRNVVRPTVGVSFKMILF